MLQSNIIRTKLLVPRSGSETLARQRLYNALDEGSQKRLTLVCAPAGFGKTTLVTSWFRAQSIPSAWISLDERDKNLHGFLSYLWEACIPFIPETAEVMIAGLSAQKDVSAEDNCIRLINAVAQSESPLTLVLDDYHMIEEPDIHNFVRLLVQDAPPDLNLIITTRSDPPLQLAKLRAKSDLLELRSSDLVFNSDEFKSFITSNSSLSFSEEQIQTLHAKTDGWITAARLALLSISSQDQISDFIDSFGGTDRHIMDYLIEEVLDHLDDETRSFLYRTSILGRLNARLCDHLLGWQSSSSILDKLEKQNLFIVSLDNQRNWYRYHPLIAQILQHRLNAQHGQDLPGLHHRASEWFSNEENISEAIYHATQADDVSLVAELIRENGGRMLQKARLVELSEWFSLLDDADIRKDSLLCLNLAWTLLLMGDLAGARDYTQQAVENPPGDFGLENIPASISAIEAYLALFSGNPGESIAAAQQAMTLYDDEDHSSISVVAFVLGNALALAGLPREAIAAHSQAIRSARTIRNVHIELPAKNATASLLCSMGQLNAGQEIYEDNLSRYSNSASMPVPLATSHFGLAETLLYRLEYAEASSLVKKGLEIADRWGNAEAAIHAYLVELHVNLVHGKHGKARRSLDKVEELLVQRNHQYQAMSNVHAAHIQFLLVGENVPAARSYLDQNQVGLKGEPQPHRIPEYLGEIQVLLAEGEAALALKYAQRLVEPCQKAEKFIFLIYLDLLQAAALSMQGQSEPALACLKTALDRSLEQRILRPFLTVHAYIKDLIARLSKGADEQLNSFLSRIELESSASGIMDTDGGLVEKLSKRELEVLQLLARGLTNDELANQLFVSIATVKTHLLHIYAKLDVKNRTSAIDRARQLGLV